MIYTIEKHIYTCMYIYKYMYSFCLHVLALGVCMFSFCLRAGTYMYSFFLSVLIQPVAFGVSFLQSQISIDHLVL